VDVPRQLHDGACLFVWAPSSPAPAVFSRRFTRGVDALRAAGYEVVVGRTCRSAEGPSTLVPEEIAAELHDALDDPRHDGVMAAIGGWTCLAVLPFLDTERIAGAGKPIIGYSDLTCVLNHVARRGRLVTYHGPMVLSEWGEHGGPWRYTMDAFRRVLHAPPEERVKLPATEAWSDEMLWWDRDDTRPRRPREDGERPRTLVPGAAEGVLWGGSLLSLGLLVGTPYWPEPDEPSILLLEAEAIAPDELWIRLEQLRLAGAFRTVRGVAVGKIGNPRATAAGFADFDEVVRVAVPSGIAVAAGLDVGHTEPMLTLPIGGTLELECPAGSEPNLAARR
jgi:muramoyltetrapeptide carboxypeptidase